MSNRTAESSKAIAKSGLLKISLYWKEKELAIGLLSSKKTLWKKVRHMMTMAVLLKVIT